MTLRTDILRGVEVDSYVSPHGIRDGDPDALAELCARRGAAVLAFAEHVAAPGQASRAAADAFARFRRAVVVAADFGGLDPDELLLSATRGAALSRSIRAVGRQREDSEGGSEVCDRFEESLAQWVEDALPEPATEHFRRHLGGCALCRASLERFEAGLRAFRSPPDAPLPPAIAHSIMRALAMAAPVAALAGDPERVIHIAEGRLLVANARRAENAQPAEPVARSRAPVANRGSGAEVTTNGAQPQREPAGVERAPDSRRVAPPRHRPVERADGPRRPLPPRAVLRPSVLALIGVGGAGALLALSPRLGAISGGPAVAALTVFGFAIWLAGIWWTHADARRRMQKPWLVGVSTACSVLPALGPIVYMILRPPESLDDVHERDVSIASSERLIALLIEMEQTQREIHDGVKHLEQALHDSRRRAAARKAAQARAAPEPPARHA